MKIRQQVQKLKWDKEMQHSDFIHLPAVLHPHPPPPYPERRKNTIHESGMQ
jgi:hypothetical protein